MVDRCERPLGTRTGRFVEVVAGNVLRGMQDHGNPPEYEKEIHEAVPGSQYVKLPEAGHFPVTEVPDKVNALIEKFVAALWKRILAALICASCDWFATARPMFCRYARFQHSFAISLNESSICCFAFSSKSGVAKSRSLLRPKASVNESASPTSPGSTLKK